jgi:hypothetical protein
MGQMTGITTVFRGTAALGQRKCDAHDRRRKSNPSLEVCRFMDENFPE